MTATIRSPSQAVSSGAADHAGDADRHTQGQSFPTHRAAAELLITARRLVTNPGLMPRDCRADQFGCRAVLGFAGARACFVIAAALTIISGAGAWLFHLGGEDSQSAQP